MPDIIASLLKTLNDETGPQHKKHGLSEFEWSEGSDGAVHSKIVDENGEPIDPRQVSDADALTQLQELKQKQQEIDDKIQQLVEGQGNVNFPDNQPVSDADVLQAIQALQQENAETKQLVNSILERLDGTFNTRLTGSLMEDDEAIPVDQLTRNFKVMVFDASLQETIPPGEDRTWDIYAPEGWIVSEIVDVRMLVDYAEGRTEGTHILSFGRTVLSSRASRGDYAISSGSVNGQIIFNGGTGFNTEENDTFPNQPTEILTAYKLLSFDDETPIQAYYRNYFDVEQTYRIFIRLKCIVEKKVG